MPDHKLGAWNSRVLQTVGRPRWTALPPLLFVLSLGYFTWQLTLIAGSYHPSPGRGIRGWVFPSLLLLHILLTPSSAWAMTQLVLPKKWRLRGAFLTSAGLGLFHGVVNWLSPELRSPVLIPLAALGGAFLGGLTITALQTGLWENNMPPPDRIQAEVHAWHLALVGPPPPKNVPKLLFDRSLAAISLLISAPFWLLISFLVWFEDPGPLIFIKNSVGRGGVNFHQYKFRTMVSDAERATGPVLSSDGDARVLRIGRLLRKTALDELPQLVNILRGEMSFVGPRPQRTVLVHGYLQELPDYARRHQVPPGLAGLAQVAGDYYLTPRQKLRYDRLYASHANLGFDLKLLLAAFALVFWLRWNKDWDGQLPRRWLRRRSRSG